MTDQTVSPSPWAHSRNPAGRRHLLEDHHRVTARLARGFANDFGAGDLAYYAALWHDVGKFNPAFQDYLFRAVQSWLLNWNGVLNIEIRPVVDDNEAKTMLKRKWNL